jgi:hypothetical protein
MEGEVLQMPGKSKQEEGVLQMPGKSKKEDGVELLSTEKDQGNEDVSKDHFDFLWGEYEKQTNQTKKYQAEGMDIYPRTGVVLKTWVLDASQAASASDNNPTGIVPRAKQKCFINICAHESIEAPSEVTEIPEHLKAKGGYEHLDNNETKMRMPLSCGPLRQCIDQSNMTALVFESTRTHTHARTTMQGRHSRTAYIHTYTKRHARIQTGHRCGVQP